MIKDKITSELKARFAREIQKTVRTGNEHGFLICVDPKGKLYPTKSTCEGKECINMESLISECSHKVQGDFHTHPDVAWAMQVLKKDGTILPFKVARDIYLKAKKETGEAPREPSHGDLLTSVTKKYDNLDLGTTCIASDAIPNEIECWSIKNEVTKEDYERAEKESDSPLVNDAPHDWIKPLFIKEIIDLKR
jgi:hypothetical protein